MQLQQISVDILTQLNAVCKQLTDNSFSQPLNILSNNSIGKHIRHIIEFYDLMMIGKESGAVNYDKRSHDKVLEENRVMAIEKLNSLGTEILNFEDDQPLKMSANYSIDEENPIAITTSLYRELQYNIEHAVHHMAIIKIALLNEFPGIKIAEGFGIAYSTIKFANENLRFTVSRRDFAIKEVRFNLTFDILSKDFCNGKKNIESQLVYDKKMEFDVDINQVTETIEGVFKSYLQMSKLFKEKDIHVKSTVVIERDYFFSEDSFIPANVEKSYETQGSSGSKKLKQNIFGKDSA